MTTNMKRVDEAPLPYPFCGEEPAVYEFTTHMEFIVTCASESCKVQPYTRIRDSREKALADWNGRAGDV